MPTTRKTSKTSKTEPTVADKIVDFLNRYMYFSDEHYADILAVYVIHTWTFDAFKTTPYIYINSIERGSGKTTLLELLQVLCKNPDMPGNMSAAAMYAMIEHMHPTLLIDEVDAVWSGSKNEDLRGMINTGYKSSGSVTRNTGISKDENDPGYRKYSTFCPKVLAGINNGMLPDTVADRSIFIDLRKAQGDAYNSIEDFYEEDVEDEIGEIRDMLEAFAGVNMEPMMLRENRPARLEGIGPRQNQIATPLLTVAARVGNGWYDRIKDAVLFLLAPQEDKMSPQIRVLWRIRDWFHAHPEAVMISSNTIMSLNPEHTGQQLGRWLNVLGLNSVSTGANRFVDENPNGVKNMKGYRKADFLFHFSTLLPEFIAPLTDDNN